jgi:hypothetical protein
MRGRSQNSKDGGTNLRQTESNIKAIRGSTISTHARSLLKSYMNTTENIRPSVAFTSSSRD